MSLLSRSVELLPVIESLLMNAEARFAYAGIVEARANAEFILSSVLGVGRLDLRLQAQRVLMETQRRRFLDLVERRSQRQPLAYVLGSQNFMGMELRVTPDVLIPRPETEELVELALQVAMFDRLDPSFRSRDHADRPIGKSPGRIRRILDIGTGSGCIALALARSIPKAQVYAVDRSPAALKVAEENAARQGLEDRVHFSQADLFNLPSFSEQMDLIIANPPYVESGRIETLEPEVRHEPRIAQDGGSDGLDALRSIIRQSPRLLRPGGWLVLEIDHGQGPRVVKLLNASGFAEFRIQRDLSGLERIAVGKLGVPRLLNRRSELP